MKGNTKEYWMSKSAKNESLSFLNKFTHDMLQRTTKVNAMYELVARMNETVKLSREKAQACRKVECLNADLKTEFERLSRFTEDLAKLIDDTKQREAEAEEEIRHLQKVLSDVNRRKAKREEDVARRTRMKGEYSRFGFKQVVCSESKFKEILIEIESREARSRDQRAEVDHLKKEQSFIDQEIEAQEQLREGLLEKRRLLEEDLEQNSKVKAQKNSLLEKIEKDSNLTFSKTQDNFRVFQELKVDYDAMLDKLQRMDTLYGELKNERLRLTRRV